MKIFTLSIRALKRVLFEGLLYFTNRFVAHIPFHFIRLFFYRFCLGFEIGSDSLIFMDAWFDTRSNFKMGKSSVINQKCRLDNRGGITIGDNVSISAEVCILTADHDLQSSNFKGRHSPVNIEDYVFIGTRAIVLPGVTLSKGSAVASGAVVTKDVAPFTIVAGVPAKPIGSRPDDLKYSANYQRLFF
ncbi:MULTISPECIES: acyltransferase [Cyanophyceae]|uniref:acyltransferase n=1 Tax=Cyanophyceae TaxID=3028117 RepID=UPI001682193B|nr:acyltransferase [Trichocoleus sp. FACHB-69]MBD1934332.1 acyltransferase [Trichocoleus sp. FACHB-69]